MRAARALSARTLSAGQVLVELPGPAGVMPLRILTPAQAEALADDLRRAAQEAQRRTLAAERAPERGGGAPVEG